MKDWRGIWVLAVLGPVLLVAPVYMAYQQESVKAKVEFTSPTECKNSHGVYRWTAKLDESKPPNPDKIESVTPATMDGWEAPHAKISEDTLRLGGKEQQWFELTGKVVLVKCEEDGDLHVQLEMANGNGGINVVAEVPVGPAWDAIREEIFSWGRVKFPCEPHKLALRKHPVVKVTGKAFFDAEHSSKADPTRRSYDRNVLVWEIHPVAKLTVMEHEIGKELDR